MTTVVLPLPPISLKTNRTQGAHWGSYHKAKVAYQDKCREALQAYHWTDDNEKYPVHLYITAYVGYRQQLPDLTDLGTWVKAGVDAMVTFGVFVDDDPAHLSPVTLDAKRDRVNPRIEVAW